MIRVCIRTDTLQWGNLSIEIYFGKAVLQVIAASRESEIISSNA